ncbi:MAG: trigger factor [Candidatus Omnitrophica bacterium]|nr:trigger factor [Candidatus Omnitrophota bacterium]MDD5592407.1 trigger factor [Candidatus Omnitrophota bacterium]
MKIEVKKLDGNKREVSVEISGDIVKNKFEDVFKKIAKEAKVPGFRPGNAPRDILEKHYSSHAHEQVLKELIPELYNQAIEKEGLDIVELPNIFDVKLERDNLSFKAHVEISPQVSAKNYKGIRVNYKKIEVTPDELKRSLDSLKESRKVEVIDDNFAKGLGYPNLLELEKAFERQIYLQKESLQRQKIENEIVEAITKGLDFKLPSSMVTRQLDDLVRQTKLDLALKGIPRDKIDGQDKVMRQELEPQAKRQVKVYLVLSAIAKKENIAQDDHMPAHVIEFLLKEANWQEGGN